MIKDDGKFYTVIKVVNGKDIDYTEIEYKYGKQLIDEKNQILREYLEWDKKRLEKVAASIENKDGENVEARKKQLVDNLAEINDVLEVVAYGRNV
jgi:tRNA (adenine22-N1)-methyltransferase